jgi:hypothetical protein
MSGGWVPAVCAKASDGRKARSEKEIKSNRMTDSLVELRQAAN